MANCTARGSSPNTYASGNCTWYVASKVPSVPNDWGNAAQWLAAAKSCGWNTGGSPQVGAIVVYGPAIDPPQGYGHVALVTSLASGGTFMVTEMNWQGLGKIDTRQAGTNVDKFAIEGFIYPSGVQADPGSSTPVVGGLVNALTSQANGINNAISGFTTGLENAGIVVGGIMLLVAGLITWALWSNRDVVESFLSGVA